jgi:O-acetylserine/cysteine efflux transporter
VNNVFAKIAIDALPPMMMVACRFGLVLAAVFLWLKPPPKGQAALFFAMLLVLGPVHFGIQAIGLKLATDLPPMVVAMQLWAPCSVLFAALLLKERVSPLRWAGVGLAFAGAASLNFDPVVFSQGWALVLVGTAAASYGLGAVLVRRLGGGLDPWATQAWIALITAPTMALGSAVFETGHLEAARAAHWSVWLFIAFGAIVSSIVANAFMFRLVQRYEVSRTTPFMLLSPVITFTLASIILGDVITPQMLLGAAATMGGVVLVALAERRFRAAA